MNDILKFTPHLLLRVNGLNYVFISRNGILCELDDKAMQILSCEGINMDEARNQFCEKFNSLQQEFDQTIQQLQEVSLIELDSIKYQPRVVELCAIMLMVSQCCNLCCSYCYGGQGEYHNSGTMPEDIAKKSVDYLLENAVTQTVSIAFFGGEPLINFNLIKRVVEYADSKALECNKNVNYAITTNATLIDDEITNFLLDHDFRFTISIDGSQSQHDKYRLSKTGNGSYIMAKEGFDRVSSSRILLVRATMEDIDYSFKECLESVLYGLNAKVYISPAIELYTYDNIQKLISQYDIAVNSFTEDLHNHKYDKCKKNLIVYQTLQRIALYYKKRTGCDALIHSVAIDIDGNIYPCHRFVGNSQFVIGNVVGTTLSNLSDFYNNKLHHNCKSIKCSSCWAYNLCAGGCYHDNFISTGDCVEPNNIKCTIAKYTNKRIIEIYLGLTQEQKVNLNLTNAN